MKAFAVLLVVIFSCYAFYPVGVVIWFHANRAQIAETMCENKDLPELKCKGNCVLNKKVNQAQKDNPDSPLPSAMQKWAETVAFLIPVESNNSLTLSTHTHYPDAPVKGYHYLFVENVFRPPIS